MYVYMYTDTRVFYLTSIVDNNRTSQAIDAIDVNTKAGIGGDALGYSTLSIAPQYIHIYIYMNR